MITSLKNFRSRAFAALFILALLVLQVPAQNGAAAPAGSLSTEERALASTILIESIKTFTGALAADDMEGRGTMQPGGDKAAEWIAARFRELGLKPLGDKGTYLQAVKFRETSLGDKTSFKVGGEDLKMGKDWGALPYMVSNTSVSGDLVFVAYGIVADSIKRNDVKGLNLNGKIAVMMQGPPAGIPEKAWNDQDASQIFITMLLQSGVKGIVFVSHGREQNPYDVVVDYFARRQVEMADSESNSSQLPPFIYVSDSAAEKLFSKSGVTFKEARERAERNDFEGFELKQKAEISLKPKTVKGTSPNVVGFIEGSDPKLKAEAIVFSAHYDAYGKDNGKIYNGAADNALGTAEMIAVAEAFSKMDPKPKRSLVFLAVTGEEYGLYGSKYWAQKPTWDISKVAANLNLDGIGTEVYGPVKLMVGYGAEHSTLGTMMDDVAKPYGISVLPDPMPEEQVFLRSDHYSFVERGVPALMLMGGPEGTAEQLVEKIKAWEKVHYHQATDDVMEGWHWEGAKTVADIMGILGLRIAQQEAMPSWLSSSPFGKLKRGNTDKLPDLD